MKIIILLIAILLGFGATLKKSAADQKEISARVETQSYQSYPNLLPEVKITALPS
ncbi:hypothetical protein ACFSRY_09725 [Pontibacter locisalis]|uniref:Uncharacterized protein n=1 Tax=Pontibacter locisalis TaxID=1719035 RepID=A0ABW5IMY3_9BACT